MTAASIADTLLVGRASPLLHPAFDIQGPVTSFGFLAEKPKGKRGAVYVVHVPGHPIAVLEGDGTVGKTKVEYRQSTGSLADLDRQWGVERLRTFLEADRVPEGPELYASLKETWQRHVYFEHPGEYVIAACWGLMTYVYPAFPSVPFLHFLGDKGSGKSQALELLQEVARDGEKSDLTLAAIGDLIEARRATVLIDQVNHADSLPHKLVSSLTDSYRRGARRGLILDGSGKDRRRRVFETFGPKAFAGTQALPEDLKDRAIVLGMTNAPTTLPPPRPGDPTLRDLRATCYAWALGNGWTMSDLWETLNRLEAAPIVAAGWPDLAKYVGRPRDLWLPIECIMEALRVPEADRAAAREYYAQSHVVATAEPPQDRYELVQALWHFATKHVEGSTFHVRRSELEPVLNEQHIDLEWPWNANKIGVGIKGLGPGVLVSKPMRSRDRRDTIYEIDRANLGSLAKKYGLTE